ncbi:MAG: hypothetical protein FJ388_00515 [Verrucomicrobia bacterium]|nr:hypothetical protein [Verrucomicrobiota bacterium]
MRTPDTLTSLARFAFLAASLLCLPTATAAGPGRTFFVATSGNDANDGLSQKSPWRSLKKVNAADLHPGDKVLFKRRDTWRGQLVPQSGREGASITYSAYGKGARPLLLGSVSRNDPRNWQHEGGNIWVTAKPVFTELETRDDLTSLRWSVHAEAGAKVRATTSQVGADVGGENVVVGNGFASLRRRLRRDGVSCEV